MMAKHLGRSEATISNRCVGHARLFARLRDGKGCTLQTFRRAEQWFSDNWPDDLEWPAGIARPKRPRRPPPKGKPPGGACGAAA